MDGSDALRQSKYLPLPRESEYIEIHVLPIDFLFSFYSLKEAENTWLEPDMKPGTHFSLDAPFFHTLKVLIVQSISSSFFLGQTFHKLERFNEEHTEGSRLVDEPILEQGPLTEMPVCTRLFVPLSTLAILRLPQIRELCVYIPGGGDHIWEKRIAVNANLSGLKLLHAPSLWNLPSITFIKILALLPALEALIIGVDYHRPSIFVDCLEAFVPMNVPGSSGLNQLSWEGQISGVLCPRLESLQIEGTSLTRKSELMPVLKDIVTLRAAIGSPLKSFTFYFHEHPAVPQMWQLIGKDQGFMMEEIVPAERLRLDI